jgi:hypothetical protein
VRERAASETTMYQHESAEEALKPREGRRGRIWIIAAWAALQIVAPILYLELYPFSRSPMFRDAPRLYTEYEVVDDEGRSLPLADFQLSRVYFGNPPGLGVGYEPPATIDRFGEVTPEEALLSSVGEGLSRRGGPEVVTVTRRVIGAVDARTVGVISAQSWRVKREGAAEEVVEP